MEYLIIYHFHLRVILHLHIIQYETSHELCKCSINSTTNKKKNNNREGCEITLYLSLINL